LLNTEEMKKFVWLIYGNS